MCDLWVFLECMQHVIGDSGRSDSRVVWLDNEKINRIQSISTYLRVIGHLRCAVVLKPQR